MGVMSSSACATSIYTKHRCMENPLMEKINDSQSLNLLVAWGIAKLGWTETRVGLTAPLSVVVTLISFNHMLTEESLHLNPSRLIL